MVEVAGPHQFHGNGDGHRAFLKELSGGDPRVEFRGPYRNDEVGRVLGELDVVVVPSLWLENAPLVIQEAEVNKLLECVEGAMMAKV